jgi:NAD-dependent deacetylase
MNIVVFTGAGVSAESGINTFRDIKNGLWYNHNVEEVATLAGWKKNRGIVLDFHNHLRKGLADKKPNLAHTTIASWEKDHHVTVITQNVDDLHEQAGSSNVLHLHGELNKCRSTLDNTIFDLNGNTLELGQKCPKGSQLRPHTVLFDEIPYNLEESVEALTVTDMLIVVGTSLEITYTLPLLSDYIPSGCKVYYIDPQPNSDLSDYIPHVKFICKKATEGVLDVEF